MELINDFSGNGISYYQELGFDEYQIDEIRSGFRGGLSPEQIQVFADLRLSQHQMNVLRYGLSNGFSVEEVSAFAKPSYDSLVISSYLRALHQGFTLDEVITYQKECNLQDAKWYDIDGVFNVLSMGGTVSDVHNLQDSEFSSQLYPKAFALMQHGCTLDDLATMTTMSTPQQSFMFRILDDCINRDCSPEQLQSIVKGMEYCSDSVLKAYHTLDVSDFTTYNQYLTTALSLDESAGEALFLVACNHAINPDDFNYLHDKLMAHPTAAFFLEEIYQAHQHGMSEQNLIQMIDVCDNQYNASLCVTAYTCGYDMDEFLECAEHILPYCDRYNTLIFLQLVEAQTPIQTIHTCWNTSYRAETLSKCVLAYYDEDLLEFLATSNLTSDDMRGIMMLADKGLSVADIVQCVNANTELGALAKTAWEYYSCDVNQILYLSRFSDEQQKYMYNLLHDNNLNITDLAALENTSLSNEELCCKWAQIKWGLDEQYAQFCSLYADKMNDSILTASTVLDAESIQQVLNNTNNNYILLSMMCELSSKGVVEADEIISLSQSSDTLTILEKMYNMVNEPETSAFTKEDMQLCKTLTQVTSLDDQNAILDSFLLGVDSVSLNQTIQECVTNGVSLQDTLQNMNEDYMRGLGWGDEWQDLYERIIPYQDIFRTRADASLLLNPELTADQRHAITEILDRYNNPDAPVFVKSFTWEEKQFCANPSLSDAHIDCIAMALEDGATITDIQPFINDAKWNPWQMYTLAMANSQGLTMEQMDYLANPQFDDNQMRAVVRCYNNGLSVESIKSFMDTSLTPLQIDMYNTATQMNIPKEQIDNMTIHNTPNIETWDQLPCSLLALGCTPEQIEEMVALKENIDLKPALQTILSNAGYSNAEIDNLHSHYIQEEYGNIYTNAQQVTACVYTSLDVEQIQQLPIDSLNTIIQADLSLPQQEALCMAAQYHDTNHEVLSYMAENHLQPATMNYIASCDLDLETVQERFVSMDNLGGIA